MSNGIVGVIVLGGDGSESKEEILEVLAEELGLDLCHLVELHEGVLKHGLIILFNGLEGYLSHQLKQVHEITGVFSLRNLKEVGDSLEGGEVDIE